MFREKSRLDKNDQEEVRLTIVVTPMKHSRIRRKSRTLPFLPVILQDGIPGSWHRHISALSSIFQLSKLGVLDRVRVDSSGKTASLIKAQAAYKHQNNLRCGDV
jgi:hypothetical protein